MSFQYKNSIVVQVHFPVLHLLYLLCVISDLNYISCTYVKPMNCMVLGNRQQYIIQPICNVMKPL